MLRQAKHEQQLTALGGNKREPELGTSSSEHEDDGDATDVQLETVRCSSSSSRSSSNGDGGVRAMLESAPSATKLAPAASGGLLRMQLKQGPMAGFCGHTADLSGCWIKDKKASGNMDKVLQAMGMRGLMRQAVRLLKGMNIKHSDDAFTIEVFSHIGWFKMTEEYSMCGEPALHRRRDMRKGRHTGSVRAVAAAAAPSTSPSDLARTSAGSNSSFLRQLSLSPSPNPQPSLLVMDLAWDEPFAGTGMDVYELVDPDQLHLHSTMKIGGEEVTCSSVFRRKGSNGKKN